MILLLGLPVAAVGAVLGAGCIAHTVQVCQHRYEYTKDVREWRDGCMGGDDDWERTRRECMGAQYYSPISQRFLPCWGETSKALFTPRARSASDVM